MNDIVIKQGTNYYRLRECEFCHVIDFMTDYQKFCSPECSRQSQKVSKLEKNVTYIALHKRVYTTKGKASKCVIGCRALHFEWACIGDYENINDYIEMCKPCHTRLDQKRVAVL